MKSLRKFSPIFRLIFASLVLTIAITLLYRGASGPISAQQSQTQQERQVENTIKHAPLEVKLTKEKEKNWKDLKNENWVSDFEVEITNTGSKPIYTFGLILYFDVPNEHQEYFRADIIFGRLELSRIGSRPTAEDIPLKPGESKTFTLQPGAIRALENGRREKGWRLPTKVRIKLGNLNFGDGTGLILDQPVPSSNRSPETSKLENFSSQSRRRKRASVNWRLVTMDVGTRDQKNHNSLPAFLPVSYFRADSTLAARDAAVLVEECQAVSPLPALIMSRVLAVSLGTTFGIRLRGRADSLSSPTHGAWIQETDKHDLARLRTPAFVPASPLPRQDQQPRHRPHRRLTVTFAPATRSATAPTITATR